MFDRTNVRSHWPLLSYFNNPITSLKQRLENQDFNELKVGLDFNPMEHPNGVDTSYRLFLNIVHGMYAKLSTIYCCWENGKEVLDDTDIRRLMVSTNYDVYEAYLHLLKLGAIYLPALRANGSVVDNFKSTLIEFMYRANVAFPNRFAYGIPPDITKISQEERFDLEDGGQIPEIMLEREFLFHLGTNIALEDIVATVDIRDEYNTEHPSIGRILEMLRILEITISQATPEDLNLMSETGLQTTLITLLYTFGRWNTYTVAMLLKDDQVLRDQFEEMGTGGDFRNYRDAEINSLINPLLITSTSIN